MTIGNLFKPVAALIVVASILLYWRHWIHEQRAIEKAQTRAQAERREMVQGRSPHPAPLSGSKIVETVHYAITTTADAAQTQHVADAVETLYVTHHGFFSKQRAPSGASGKLKLTLYAHQAQFKANNRSLWWAEAYYLRPVCYAYYAKGDRNPYHWMIHEATHQLNAEVARFPKIKWVDEGLATYFGTSRIAGGTLLPGKIDLDTYPIWHLDNSGLSGSLDADIRDGRWIPIRALITGRDAPDIASNVNRYYIQYWSLSHFLFHGENGRYADAYQRLIAEGGSLANFEKRIGPADRIEVEWYRYLQEKIAELAPKGDDPDTTTVVWSD
jgi:Protein of unknown function (DUF1570)